ncbi:hypothetical protein [Methanoculleus chikugoensis]|uniref:hypothetical protein n=1 Tax=Methanoculleus chikugoensis TaxID=118126 RepID=UPI000B1EB143|nr:hypothetical protein [Methanoculleus chikugoensis]
MFTTNFEYKSIALYVLALTPPPLRVIDDGSQNRSSLSATGPGIAHYPKRQIGQIETAVSDTPTEAGRVVAAKILLSVFAPPASSFFAIAVAAILLITILQKVAHYAEIAEREGTDAAMSEIMEDVAKGGVIHQYLTDSAMDLIVDSENISPQYKEQLETIMGMVIDQGIDSVEEAFLNE